MTLALREIATLQPLYTVPGDDLVGEVLIPAMSAASSLRCMAGFFSSAAFRHVAPGIATFINATEGVFRLLISPALDDADREAIRTALVRPEDALRRAAEILLEGARLSESALEQHTLDCLSYLLAAGRLAPPVVRSAPRDSRRPPTSWHVVARPRVDSKSLFNRRA